MNFGRSEVSQYKGDESVKKFRKQSFYSRSYFERLKLFFVEKNKSSKQ